MTSLERPDIGEPAPTFELPVHGGGTWSLRDHLGSAPILLVFHRHIH